MMIDIHTHNPTPQKGVLKIFNQYPHLFNEDIPFYSIGIHPWYINTDTIEEELLFIEKKSAEYNCLAIGECGLDKNVCTPMDIQKKIFIAQIKLAEKQNKPIIIHCVKAFQEIIEIKQQLKTKIPLIIHGFAKNTQVAEMLIQHGFHLSFGHKLLDNKSLQSTFEKIPKNRIFLETDNSNANITSIYAFAEQIKQQSFV